MAQEGGESNNAKSAAQQHSGLRGLERTKSAEKEMKVKLRKNSPRKIIEDIFWYLKKLSDLEMSESFFFPIRSLNK